MADEKYHVSTIYDVDTRDAKAKVSDLQRALGGLSSAAGMARSALSTIARTAMVAGGGAIATIVGLGHHVMELGSQAADSRLILGGMFATFGQARDLTGGLQVAESVMNDIVAASARLPGEAQDYLGVFQAAFSNLNEAMDGNVSSITAFSNDFTATAMTFGVSADQVSMDLTRLAQAGSGGIGEMNVTMRRLLPYVNAYRESLHQSHMTLAQISALNGRQRVELMQHVVGMNSLREMRNRGANSWSAMTGGFKSAVELITRQATSPLFEGVRSTLQSINGLLMDGDGHLTAWSQRVVRIGTELSTRVVAQARAFANAVAPHAAGLGGGVGGLGVTSGSAMLGLTMGGPTAAVLVGAFSEMARNASFVSSMFDALAEFAPAVAGALGPASSAMSDFLIGVLPPFVHGIAQAVAPIQGLINAIRPYVAPIARDLGALLLAIGNSVGLLITTLTPVFREIVSLFSTLLGPIGQLAGQFNNMMDDIRRARRWQTDQDNLQRENNERAAALAPLLHVTGVGNLANELAHGLSVRSLSNLSTMAAQYQREGMSQRGMEVLLRRDAESLRRGEAVLHGMEHPVPTAPGAPPPGTRTHAPPPQVNVTVHQTVERGDDFDRVLEATREGLLDALTHGIESAHALVTR